MVAIDVRNLSVGYGQNVLLQNLNFSVNEGEIFVILGGSGCGKSSLLKNLFGLYEPLAGSVLIEGPDITDEHGQDRKKF
jgi:phospholipid/cholesterol/gamma-HCH transport system ATP-binding protein